MREKNQNDYLSITGNSQIRNLQLSQPNQIPPHRMSERRDMSKIHRNLQPALRHALDDPKKRSTPPPQFVVDRRAAEQRPA
jgi:hypothetical protein